MEDYPYEKGCLYIFDKAYMKTAGLNVINRCGAFFIVRRKKNVLYEEVERRECDRGESAGRPNDKVHKP